MEAAALRAELYGGMRVGFWHAKRALLLALDAREEGQLDRPAAWALALVRGEGLRELERDYGEGAIGPKKGALKA